MFMNAAEREQPSVVRADRRVAFALLRRLNDLLAPFQPGKARDQLRGRRAAASGPALHRPGDGQTYRRVQPLSREQGHRASSAEPSPPGLARRFDLPRPLDPETEVLVLNGTREGLFLAALARQPQRRAKARPRRPSSSPIPAMAPIRPAPRPRIARRSICRPPRATGFLPDLDAHRACAARAHGRLLPRLARQSAGLGRERATICAS